MKFINDDSIRKGFIKYEALLKRLEESSSDEEKETINYIMNHYYESKEKYFKPISEVDLKVNLDIYGTFVPVLTNTETNEIEYNNDFIWKVNHKTYVMVFKDDEIVFNDSVNDYLSDDELKDKNSELFKTL